MEPLTLPRKELNQFKAELNPKITNLASSGHPIQTSQSARPNRPPPHGEQKSTAAGKKGMGGRRDARTLPPKEMRSTSTDRAEPPESPIPAAAAADRTGAAVEVAWHRLPSSPLLPPPVSPTTPSLSPGCSGRRCLASPPAHLGGVLGLGFKPSVVPHFLCGAAFWALAPGSFRLLRSGPAYAERANRQVKESIGYPRLVKSTILGVHCTLL